MLRLEDAGEVAYGALVQVADYMDEKNNRVDIWKKWSTWAYLVPGGVATVMSGFDFMPRYGRWAEHVSHGFLYDVPRFLRNFIKTGTAGNTTKSRAVQEAQRILAQNRTLAAPANRFTQYANVPEFEQVSIWG